MRRRAILVVVSAAVIIGCSASPTGPASTPADSNTNSNGQSAGGGNGNTNTNDNVFGTVERFNLVATVVGAGSVEPSAGTYDSGAQVNLTATADAGWAFDRWEGDASGAEPTVTVTIVRNTVVTARFINAGGAATPPPDGGGTPTDPTVSPGSSFSTAPLVDLGTDDRLTTNQTLAQATDVHVYDVGALATGDRVTATCQAAPGSTLDPMTALFDASQYRVFWNDDIDLVGGNYDSRLDDLIRHDSDHHYLAITSTDFQATRGDYTLTIEVQRGAGAVQVAGQTLLLDLDGQANVTVAGTNWGTFSAFDGADINAALAGQTDALKQGILAVVQADFAPYDVTVVTTDDPVPAAPYTTVYLGGTSDQLFGIADNIDFYNANQQDDAVVFTGAFSGLGSNVASISQAIGNVVSHEVGHALGLMHTTDVTELMDTTGAANVLLVDQSWGAATVFDFPIGFQNAAQLLEETLGLSARPRVTLHDDHLHCGTCGAKLYTVNDLAPAR